MFRLLPCGPVTTWNAAGIGTPAGQLEPSGTPGTVLPFKGSQRGLERAQHHWNHLEQPAGLTGTPGTVLPSKGSQRGLELPEGHSLSAEREVDAGNR